MASHDFSKVLEAIDSLIPKAVKPVNKGASPAQKSNAEAMAEGMAQLGITREQLDRLKVIHIAGTKGKGSTASMCESIMRYNGLRTALYTSPHLVSVTERIRINGVPIPEPTFAKYFWEVWEKIIATSDAAQDDVPKTTFFRFMTLLALYAFTKEDIDVAVVEVGMGGRLDATNAIPAPVVCGITHIGLDHVEVLGNTLTLIAAEKAGICKEGIPCIVAPHQSADAQEQLVKSAAEAKAPCVTCPPLSTYGKVPVGIDGVHQEDNAALAVALCQTWMQYTSGKKEIPDLPFALPDLFKKGLAAAHWDGRSQIVEVSSTLRFFIDGAHTDKSIELVRNWFLARASPQREKRIVFFCQQRDVESLLSPFKGVTALSRAHFPPLLSSKQSIHSSSEVSPEALEWVQGICDVWEKTVPGTKGVVCTSLPQVIEQLKTSSAPQGMDVLFTGSLYLAGDTLKLLKNA